MENPILKTRTTINIMFSDIFFLLKEFFQKVVILFFKILNIFINPVLIKEEYQKHQSRCKTYLKHRFNKGINTHILNIANFSLFGQGFFKRKEAVKNE